MAEEGAGRAGREVLTMAFDAFRSQTRPRLSYRRRLTYLLSAALHGALIIVGVAYSFWHVDELSPPMLRVTFMSATPPPPPPPPPPPAGGGAQKKKVTVKPKTVVTPKVAEIVQPRETPPPKAQPKPDDDDEDEPGGVKGGVKGGTAGGTIGGTVGGTIGGTIGGAPGAPLPPRFLAPNMGALQKISGDNPAFPPSLRKAGEVYAVIAKICVSRTGSVDSVTIMKKADSLLDANVVNTVKTWRFRPLMANNIAIPFCYPATFQFKSQ
jgi:protein TonB